jgi:hypothetical protein
VSHLVQEIVLRLSKVGLATVLGILVYGLAIGPFGAPPTVELGLVSWLAGAAFILLVESGVL